MPTFTHTVSEDGLSLTTLFEDTDTNVDGSITLKWLTTAEAEARIPQAKLDNERRLQELAGVGRSVKAGISRKRIGPFSVSYGSTNGDYDNGHIRIGTLAIRPTGIRRERDKKFILGIGSKNRAYALVIERYSEPEPPKKPSVTRADIDVPLRNPFKDRESVIIPAGSIVWDKGMKNTQTTDRKRTVKPWRIAEGYFSVGKLRAGLYGSGLIGTIINHKPYIVWGDKELRTEVTRELLEANGKAVEYEEGVYEDFAAYIESGDYDLEGVLL